jgi:Domain of unknown function (DUF4402)
MKNRSNTVALKIILFLAVMILHSLFFLTDTLAQEHPPRPVKINSTAQTLSFGAFYQGAGGGTITITPAGLRSATGSIVLLNLGYTYSAALFEVHAHPGTIISILNGPDAVLSRPGGGSMLLHIGTSNPASPFVSTTNFNIAIQLRIGGTLTVGTPAANPPGSYSGTFSITLVQE